MDWKASFKQGIELFKQEQFESALESFNTAIRENNHEKNLFDSRAAVYEKLNLPLDALKDAKKVIDLAPKWWQGYARSARLFHQINKHEASLKMVDIALELLKNTNSKRRDELEALRLQVTQTLEPAPCSFSKVPVEIQTEIFSLVVGKSNTRMLALTLVCRSWREIIITTPSLWRHLVLSPKTTIKQADVWLQRSRGHLSSLRILDGFSLVAKPQMFRNASGDIWTKLEALEVLNKRSSSINKVLPTGVFGKLHLQSLELYTSDWTSDFQMLRDMDTSRTRTLSLNVVREVPSPLVLTFNCLTTLILRGDFIRSDIFALFRNNPLLETVALEAVGHVSGFSGDLGHVELVHLKQFELRCGISNSAHGYLENMLLPNLEVLKLEAVIGHDAERCTDALAKQTLTRLKSFSLQGCTYFSPPLISILRASSALKVLTLSRCSPVTVDEESVIVALTGTDRTAQDLPQKACCPLLQHLDLSHSPRLKSGPITRLVKARLANNVTRSDSEPDCSSFKEEDRIVPLPILSLNIDDCPMINPDAIPWLRARVPHLSARLTPVKMGKGKR